MLTRRDVLVTGGMMTVGLMAPGWARAADVVEIQMKANAAGTETWFDPIGVHIMPGQRIRWIVGEKSGIPSDSPILCITSSGSEESGWSYG